LLEFLRHARWPDFFEQPEGQAELRQAPVVFSSSPKALGLSRRLVAAKAQIKWRIFGRLARQYRASLTRVIVQ